MRVALLYEHPEWTAGLSEAIVERGHDLTKLDVGDLPFDPMSPPRGFDVWLNRINTMPSAGRPGAEVVADTLELLHMLEERGERVINGQRPHHLGCSKADQIRLFEELGMRHPQTVVMDSRDQALEAAGRVGYPLLAKPNVGGSGSGITMFDSEDDLSANISRIDFGIDDTAILQEFVPSADDLVHRIETIGYEFIYATAQPIQPGAFNYCAADGCSIGDTGSTIEFTTPEAKVVERAKVFMRAAEATVGSIEYLVDVSGEVSFFDFNPFSNFAATAASVVGSDPNHLLVDLAVEMATRRSSVR